MIRTLVLAVPALLGVFAARPMDRPASNRGKDPELDRLVSYMEGSFASTAQAAADSAYFDIHLHMRRIWPRQKDGYWLYVEQAIASALDKPYRQRVYHVHRRADSSLVSEVFTLHKPIRFAGAWQTLSKLKGQSPDSLDARQGCEIVLAANSERLYTGQTGDQTCSSDLRGASYTSSQVRITPDTLLSWDRGYDKAGTQVWGAVKGGYLFIKGR